MGNSLLSVSEENVRAVARAGASVVAVHARPRLDASGLYWGNHIVVAADHTVRRDEDLRVTAPDGRALAAELAGRDPGTDIAVLKVPELDLPTLSAAAPDHISPGELALAVGRSADTGVIAAMGIVSGVAGSWRTWRGGRLDRFIRLDLAIHPAANGGAVVNAEGALLGIATTGLTRISPLAIPPSNVARVVEELLRRGHVARGFLGVGIQTVALPETARKDFQLEQNSALIVLSVQPGGPAAHAGVLLGDVLLRLNGQPVTDPGDLQDQLGPDSPGKTVRTSILRGGSQRELTLTVGERPSKRSD
jgi:S1-C subfamily serine protease